MTGICKFCGCTKDHPCIVSQPLMTDYVDQEIVIDSIPCAWLLDDVCTAPPCVEKAYLEARSRAEEIMLDAA